MTNRTLKQQQGGKAEEAKPYTPEMSAPRGTLPPHSLPTLPPPAPGAAEPQDSLDRAWERRLSKPPEPRRPATARPSLWDKGRLSLGAGAVALRQRLEVHGESLFFRLGWSLPVGAPQDVEHGPAEADQQQAQHVAQDALRPKRAVLGPAGLGWKGEATQGVTVRPNSHPGQKDGLVFRRRPHPPRAGRKTAASPMPPKAGWEGRGPRGRGPGSSSAGPGGTGHSPEFKQQRLLQAQQGCAHRQEEDGGAEEDVLWAVAAPQRKRSSGEQEEAEAHEPLQGEARCCRSPGWPSV